MLLPPRYLAAVVAIGTDGPNGSRKWVATGTHYAQMSDDPGQTRWFLVTNKHVIDSLQTAYLRANTWQPDAPHPIGPARELELSLRGDAGEQYWFRHPDPEVDIAVTPINVGYLSAEGVGIYFFEDNSEVLTTTEMSAAGISEGDGVYALGFPMGIVGGERNFVIARGGWIARLQDALAGESKTFLVDASVFPGQSGGPVILRPELTALQGTEAFGESRLLGIVAGYVPFHEIAVSVQTQRPRITFEENSGLARVYPVDYINETIAAIPVAEPPRAPVEDAPPAPEAAPETEAATEEAPAAD
jgi:hypothetical protein